MKQLPLSLDPEGQGPEGPQGTAKPQPVLGWLAVGCGLMGIFFSGIVFVPLAFLISIIALVAGQGVWAFSGLVLAVAGFFTSPVLLGLVGLGALAAFFGLG